MKFTQALLSGIIAAAISIGAAGAAFADTIGNEPSLISSLAAENPRDSKGLPIPSTETVLKQVEYNGKAKFKANTCYFIKSGASVTINSNKTLPASSMIVVENGGKLTLNKGAKLYAKGAVIVHSNAKLVINGQMIVKSTSALVVNGNLSVTAKGKLSVYGTAQISEGGKMNANGKITVSSGRILSLGEVKAPNGKAVKFTQLEVGANPLYIAEEYSDYLAKDIVVSGIFDDSLEITDQAEKLTLLRSFESVLYKYDGEFDGVDWGELNPRAQMIIYMCKCRPACECCETRPIYANYYSWNGIIRNYAENDDMESSSGIFYCSALGSVDVSLFALVDPNSDSYIRAEEFAS